MSTCATSGVPTHFFFKVIFGNITNIWVPGTCSKNSSGYPGAKLPEICTPIGYVYQFTPNSTICFLFRPCPHYLLKSLSLGLSSFLISIDEHWTWMEKWSEGAPCTTKLSPILKLKPNKEKLTYFPRNFLFEKKVWFLILASGGTRNFFVGGIEGEKCDSEGAKNPKFAKNGWFWPFFSSDWGGKWGAEPPTGGHLPPMPPLDAATDTGRKHTMQFSILRLRMRNSVTCIWRQQDECNPTPLGGTAPLT